MIAGTSIGTTATIVQLSIAAASFVAHIMETALPKVEPGVITAAKAIASTKQQIIRKVLMPEAMPALVSALALTIISLIACSVMAGAIGSGGLGNFAIRYGFHRFKTDVTIAAVIIAV